MTDDPYLSFTAGLQALRRRVEATGPGLGGALGVAAEPYPHQLAAVRRILTETSVRHLISDEVGLGKTVQALMVLNALRYQNPKHRAVIIVPDRLVRQWLDECWTRAHVQATVYAEDSDDPDALVRIVRPQSIMSGDFQLDTDAYDLLIVDEPQLMPDRVMRTVEAHAASFRQLLVLSATPGLRDRRKRRRLMSILEPHRAVLAEATNTDLDELIRQEETSAIERIQTTGAADPEAIYRISSSDRRIIRATRREWGRYVPQRRYDRVQIEPLNGDEERVRLGMLWLDKAAEDEKFKWRAAQALHRGKDSARAQRQLRNDQLLEKAVEASSRTPGDGRTDGLLDLLNTIWADSPEEQVVVVAGDNPTIDYLERRLRRYFSDEAGEFLISSLRRQGERTQDEAADIHAMHEQLADFSEGRSRILLIGEWIQAGLNLHYYARNIVFYSCPWDLDTVDQLIGRLDRLRPNGLWKGDKGRHFGNIRIWTLVQPATPEARVIAALEKLGVFVRPLPPLPPEIEDSVKATLHSLALVGGAGADRELAALAASWTDTGSTSQLDVISPFTREAAQLAYDQMQEMALPPPVLRKGGEDGYTARCESALEGFLNLLAKAGFFDVRHGVRDRDDDTVKCSALWYGGDPRNPAVPVSYIPRGGWMSGHIPFLYRRRSLGKPPRNTIHTDEGDAGGRLLRFFDHGEPVHEEILDGLLEHAQKVCGAANGECPVVVFSPHHPALARLQGKQLYACFGHLDACQMLPEPGLHTLAQTSREAPTAAQKRDVERDVAILKDWWRADVRWLRTCLRALMVASVLELVDGQWRPVDRDVAWSILNPLASPEGAVPRTRGQKTSLQRRILDSARHEAFAAIQKQAQASLIASRPHYERMHRTRLTVLDRELADFIAARDAAVRRLAENPVDDDPRWEGRLAAAERAAERARDLAACRRQWLDEVTHQLTIVRPQVLAELNFRPAPNDAL